MTNVYPHWRCFACGGTAQAPGAHDDELCRALWILRGEGAGVWFVGERRA